MKLIINCALFFTISIILASCVRTFDLWNTVRKNITETLDSETLLYKKYEPISRIVIQIMLGKSTTGKTFYIITDTLYKDKKTGTEKGKVQYLQTAFFNTLKMDTLSMLLKDWQRSLISKDRINAYTYQEFKVNESILFQFEFYNKIDLYYNDINRDAQLSKNEDAYSPILNQVFLTVNNRRFILKPSVFKEIFMPYE